MDELAHPDELRHGNCEFNDLGIGELAAHLGHERVSHRPGRLVHQLGVADGKAFACGERLGGDIAFFGEGNQFFIQCLTRPVSEAGVQSIVTTVQRCDSQPRCFFDPNRQHALIDELPVERRPSEERFGLVSERADEAGVATTLEHRPKLGGHRRERKAWTRDGAGVFGS
jgi:hypothetical protein